MILYAKMFGSKSLNYKNLTENVNNIIQTDISNTNSIENTSYDSIDTYEDKAELDMSNIGNNEYNEYNEYNEDNIYKVISRDDDEGDQDYYNQAVDDE